MTTPAGPDELMAVFISRQIQNDQYVAIGVNLPVSTAGVLLAHLTHAPDLRISALSYFTNLSGVETFHDLGQIASPRLARWAEAVWPLDALIYAVPRMDWCFTGALQIDMHGNTNLIGVGKSHDDLTFRGPGATGATTVMATARSFMIHVGSHSPRNFVEKCDFISAVGFGGGGDSRERLGLPGGGPAYVITPKAIMDFEETGRRMRLKHLMPGVTTGDVRRNTGFEILIPADIETMEPPTDRELDVLRTKVDVKGILRA